LGVVVVKLDATAVGSLGVEGGLCPVSYRFRRGARVKL